MTGSTQQEAIWLSFANDAEHVIINALAGTGKSFTLLHGIEHFTHGERVTLVAYNKPIADDLNAKIAALGLTARATASTIHSMGFSALRSIGRVDVARPTYKRTRDCMPAHAPMSTTGPVEKLVSLVKNTLSPTDPASLEVLAYYYNVDLPESQQERADVFGYVPDVLANHKSNPHLIDFDDMVWLPVVLGLTPKQCDVLMVDESQDLNAARQQLCLAAIGHAAYTATPTTPTRVKIGGRTITAELPHDHYLHGRLIVVGDRHQAIYGFTGADTQAMDTLTATLAATPRKVKEFPLTVTRRCPQSVTASAARIVPQFECLPDAQPGTVTTSHAIHEALSALQSPEAVNMTDAELRGHEATANLGYVPKRGDMVLCRTNAPLVEEAYALIRENVPCRIQGRDLGAGLTNLIKKLAPTHAPTSTLLTKLDAYEERERRTIAQRANGSADMQTQALQDKVACITALCEGMDTVQNVLERIGLLFADVAADQPRDSFVLLSSVHRSKGLESRVVRILRPELMPHPMARQSWERTQEMNLLYVAITRSLDVLIWHGDEPTR